MQDNIENMEEVCKKKKKKSVTGRKEMKRRQERRVKNGGVGTDLCRTDRRKGGSG